MRPTTLTSSTGSAGRARLLREAQAIARVKHPAVIAVHDVGTIADEVFVAMEYVDGRTLREWVLERSRSWREIVAMFVRAGEGLLAAHDVGLVHRDFKPDNVLVGGDEQPRVLDFGLARAADSLAARDSVDPASAPLPRALETSITRTGAFVGTPAYMAPEQFAGESADPRVDQFAFSVALYEALYGVRPFAGETLPALRDSVRTGDDRRGASARAASPSGYGSDRARPPRGTRRTLPLRCASDSWSSCGAIPRGSRRRLLLGAGAAVLLVTAGAAALVSANRGAGAAMCRGAAEKLSGIWDDGRKGVVLAAFGATGKSFAGAAGRGVSEVLDGYARAWVAMETDACVATRVRGEQSWKSSWTCGCSASRSGARISARWSTSS